MRAPDAPTGWPSAIAPPSDVQLFLDPARPERAIEAELLLAVLLVLPRGEAAEHLRGEGLVDLPVVEVVQAEAVALAGSASPRAPGRGPSAPGRGPPIASRRCGRSASRLCFFTASSEARISQAAPSVICELLPGVTLPYFRSKKGFSFARFSTEASLAHAVVERKALPLSS